MSYSLAAKYLAVGLVGSEIARLLTATAMTLWGNGKGVFENYFRIHPLLTKGSKEYGDKQSINEKCFDYFFISGASAFACYMMYEGSSQLAVPILFTSALSLIFVQSCSINYYGSAEPFALFVKGFFGLNTDNKSLGKQ